MLKPIQYLTIIGPIFISSLLLFVTGIPTLEKKYQIRYKNDQKFIKYKKVTSLLIPLPPKNAN
jgi:steroid 5-alpha reductase family enzyme